MALLESILWIRKNFYHFFPIHKRLVSFVSKKISKRKKSKYLPLSLCKNNLCMLVEMCCLLVTFLCKIGRMNLEVEKRERERVDGWKKRNQFKRAPWEHSLRPSLGIDVAPVRNNRPNFSDTRVTRDIGSTRGKNKFLMTPVPTRSSVPYYEGSQQERTRMKEEIKTVVMGVSWERKKNWICSFEFQSFWSKYLNYLHILT